MQKVIGMMNKEYIECVSLAEEKMSWVLLSKEI